LPRSQRANFSFAMRGGVYRCSMRRAAVVLVVLLALPAAARASGGDPLPWPSLLPPLPVSSKVQPHGVPNCRRASIRCIDGLLRRLKALWRPLDASCDHRALFALAYIRITQGLRDAVVHHELPFFYAAANVCVMPSYSESFGLVGLEAQACARPVVGSDVTGLRSVVRDEVSGYLVGGHDPAAYAERIGRLLDNPELAEQMGLRGRLLAQRFSWTRTADRLEDLFDGVIERAQVRVHASARQE